jgi:hypothetical protein
MLPNTSTIFLENSAMSLMKMVEISMRRIY